MKKKKWITGIIIIAFLFLAVILVAYGKAGVTELTDDEVFGLYNKAREAYGWFNLTTIPHDSEKYIEANGERYFEVVQPGITSKKALTNYLNEIFTEDVTEGLMNIASNRYVERDGKLYVLPADRGTDIFKGEESYAIARESEKQIKFTVTVEVYGDPEQRNVTGHEQHDFFLEFSGNRWRFKNFKLVR